jgi:hypothetical protein
VLLSREQVDRLAAELARAIPELRDVERVARDAGLPGDAVDAQATAQANWRALFEYTRQTGAHDGLLATIIRDPAAPRLARELLAPPGDRGKSPRVTRWDRRTVHCDRMPQWEPFAEILRRSSDEIAILAGRKGEAHEYFVERVSCLQDDPAFDVEIVAGVELQNDTYAESLLYHLGLGVTAADGLLRASARRRAVIIHPAVDVSDDAQRLRLCTVFARSIPEIAGELLRLRDTAPTRGVVIVQPIAWRPSFWERIGLSREERRTRALLGAEPAAKATPTITTLPLLHRITADELRKAMEPHLSPGELDQLLAETSRSKTSEDILETVDRYLTRRSNGANHGVQSLPTRLRPTG